MRWFIGILIAVNLGILAWGWLGDDEPTSGKLAAPGVGTIRLMGEADTAEAPVAVPIPAPPRDDGQLVAVAPDAAPPAEPAKAELPPPPVITEQPQAQEPAAPATEPEPAQPAAPVAAAEPAPAPEPAPAAEPVVSAPEPEYVPEPGLVAPVVKRTCLAIGPFATAKAAEPLRAYLAGHGEVSLDKKQVAERVGYWVLVPPRASRAAADRMAAELKAKGIKDYWVMASGDLRYGISLGVFSQKDNAESLRKRIAAKGFPVELRDKTRKQAQLWLSYSSTRPVVQADITQRAPAGVKIESRGCPATGQGG